ncbi:AcrR family transcriptional regulator [Rhizobium aquaticum]|uniref:AcrR family transcriptional regulator n=1 Tax=Rhizobium aquaticum TaxID=1549636 RepID=A0ABV2IZ30_9HYPH
MKARGRPPSEEAKRKALRAAYEILMSEGFGRLTIEAVSLRSGVGKPTIYRNWANASELAMAALFADTQDDAPAAAPRLGPALRAHLRALVTAFATTRGRQIAMALAAADPESEMTKAFRNRILLSSREVGRSLLQSAQDRAEIEPPETIDLILDMIYAPIFYRLLIGHLPLDSDFADGIADQAMKLMTPSRQVEP